MDLRPLAENEIRKLNTVRIAVLVVGLVLIAASALITFFILRKTSGDRLETWLALGVTFATCAGVIVFLLVMAGRYAFDLRGGVAAVERGTVTGKYAYKNGYSIRIDEGGKFAVPWEAYRAIEKGMEVEVQFAPRSKYLFVLKGPGGEQLPVA